MLGLSQFLQRYKNFSPPARAVRRATATAIEEVLGISVPESDIVLTSGVASVRLAGAQKSELLLHKEDILTRARAHAGGERLRDVR